MSTYTFGKRTVRDLELAGRRVLLRADFNVPQHADGSIASDYRIVQTLPTIEYLVEHGAEVVILSHLGRPEATSRSKFSLEPVAARLSELLGQSVRFIENCIGDKPRQALKQLTARRVTLLENTRFYSGEETNDPTFAAALILASQPDFVIQDGFGAVHRAHASTEGISHQRPAVAGLLLEREISTIESAMNHPKRPLVAVLGGAKISDKLPLLERFLKLADTILVGGAMANDFLLQAGQAVGKSLVDEADLAEVRRIIGRAKPNQLLLPIDAAVGLLAEPSAKRRDCQLKDVQADDMILDIGYDTMRLFGQQIKTASTIIWNGTMGYAEAPAFAQGSAAIATAISAQFPDATSIIGGGDTADFVLDWQQQHPKRQFGHISTGGGASLELMSGQKLPGVEALLNI